jgi:hypothetical protein
VNCFPQIVRRALYCFGEEDKEAWIVDYLKENNIREEDLGKAAVAAAKYLNNCQITELDDPVKVLESTGWNDLPHRAQLAVLARIGQIAMAMYFASSRDALRTDEKALGIDDLLALADKIEAKLINSQ